MATFDSHLTRRRFIAGTALAACAVAPWRAAVARTDAPLITKPIPSSGERLPVIGLGTNNFSVEAADEIAQRGQVLERLIASGCRVVDTAPAYGRSESVIGELLASLEARDRVFLATKVTTSDDAGAEGRAMIARSFDALRTDRVDLMQVHNLLGAEVMLPILREMKAAGRIRYVGITTSRQEQHERMVELMNTHPLDFIQVNYSIEDDAAAARVLPLAADKGIAVLVNMPFGGRRGGNLFGSTRGRELPEWAAEIDVASWAQYLLKYVVSHPAVTCAIPGTHRPEHARDNVAAARGSLPDAATRARMLAYWNAA
jgi:aryl-alcohol dehydrogenase-like predicted oxidoreductase